MKINEQSQPGSIYQTRDLGHEIGITRKKQIKKYEIQFKKYLIKKIKSTRVNLPNSRLGHKMRITSYKTN